MKKERLDQLLVERGLAASRQKARSLIMSGAVLVNEVPVDKAGTFVSHSASVRVRGSVSQFVSRGGDKIAAAFSHFTINIEEVVALDVGASTGGFTDCLLKNGAKRVYAVDVGTNQLDYRLRQDERVIVMEKTHASTLTPDMFSPLASLAVIDVSFIGLRKVLQPVVSVLENPALIVALVKPQFELGPEFVSKGGVVREEKLQKMAVELVEEFGQSIGLSSRGFIASPLRGEKKGNQEYFICFEHDA